MLGEYPPNNLVYMDNLFSFIKEKRGDKYIVLDIETTGLDPISDGIIELGALKIDESGKELETFHQYINPNIPIGPEAEYIHGLSNLFIKNNGKAVMEVLPVFYDFCEDCALVGQNILGFDILFINKHLKEIAYPALTNKMWDTLEMARNKIKNVPNYRLGTIASALGVPYANAHRALGDVQTTKEVFLRLRRLP